MNTQKSLLLMVKIIYFKIFQQERLQSLKNILLKKQQTFLTESTFSYFNIIGCSPYFNYYTCFKIYILLLLI